MLFIIALIITALFIYFCRGVLKKHPYVFYIGAAVITLIIFLVDFSFLPSWMNQYIIGLFSRGVIGTALFVVVMYTGALKNGTKLISELMKIRGELSIFAAILVLAHNLTYGQVYFRLLFTRASALPANQLCAAIVSLVLIAVMLVLTVTSFPQIRRKMNAKRWKQLQRTAYLFYGLIYIHVLLINVPFARTGSGKYLFNVIVYSIVFIGYAVMRVRKYLLKKNREKLTANINLSRNISIGLIAAGVVLFIIVTAAALPAGVKGKESLPVNETAGETSESTESETSEKETESTEMKSTEENSSAEALSSENNEPSAETDAENMQESAPVNGDTNEQTEHIQQNQNTNTNTNTGTNLNNSSGTNNSANANQNVSGGQQAAVPAATEAPAVTQAPVVTEAPRTYKSDGSYSGSAVCELYSYTVSVTVEISGDKISKVSITSPDASDLDWDYLDSAINGLQGGLAANQGHAGLDAVSGATYSSNAIFNAFDAAVNSAK